MIEDLFRKYVANDLQDFKGLRIVGSIPLKDAVLNDVLATLLEPPPRQAAAATGPPAPPLDAASLRGLIKRAAVQSEAGVVTLTFELSVD